MDPLPQPTHYLTNDDGTERIPVSSFRGVDTQHSFCETIVGALDTYKWREGDFLLATFPRNGTHFMWEIMNMLLRGSADYIKEPKEVYMIDRYPITKVDEALPSPRVFNTHYRLDVLPKEFRGRKTVWVVRNPKDTVVSLHKLMHQVSGRSLSGLMNRIGQMSFSDFLQYFLYEKEGFYGNYFDYTEYMWSVRDDPNMLLVYFEDLKLDPVGETQRVNEFLGTNRTPELVQQIADATNFSKMKEEKVQVHGIDTSNNVTKAEIKGTDTHHSDIHYRQGTIGDWKNHFTVANNELINSFLEKWVGGKEIPFKYTC